MNQLERFDQILNAAREANKYFTYCREHLKGERSELEVEKQCNIAQQACLNALEKVGE